MDGNDLLAIGRIAGVHGVRGTLKIVSYAETLTGVQKDGSVLIRHPSGRERAYGINGVRPYKKGVLLNKGKANVVFESNVKITEQSNNDLGALLTYVISSASIFS